MKISVTGGKGFIGSHIIKELKKNSRFRVFSLDMPECDMRDISAVRKCVSKKDIIIHAAGVNRSSESDLIEGNLLPVFNLARVCKKMKKPPKIIFLSSTQSNTNSTYGIAKKAAEIFLEDFSKKNNVPVSILRLTNVFGEGCHPFYNSVVATFSHQLQNKIPLTINNSKSKLNLVYVGDVVKEVLHEVVKVRKNPFFLKEIISNQEVSVGEIVQILKKFTLHKVSPRSNFKKKLYKTFSSYEK